MLTRPFVVLLALALGAAPLKADGLAALLARVPEKADAVIALRITPSEMGAQIAASPVVPRAVGRVLAEQFEKFRVDTGLGLADEIALVAAFSYADPSQAVLIGRGRIDVKALAKALEQMPQTKPLHPREEGGALFFADGRLQFDADGTFAAGLPATVTAARAVAKDAAVKNAQAKLLLEKMGDTPDFAFAALLPPLPKKPAPTPLDEMMAHAKVVHGGLFDKGFGVTMSFDAAAAAESALKLANDGLDKMLEMIKQKAQTGAPGTGAAGGFDPQAMQMQATIENYQTARATFGLAAKGNDVSGLWPRDKLPRGPMVSIGLLAVVGIAALNATGASHGVGR